KLAAAQPALPAAAQAKDEPAKTLRVDGPVDTVACSPDGKFLAVASRINEIEAGRYVGHELHVWDAKTGKNLRTLLQLPKGWISKVAFAADSKTLVSAVRRV